MRKCISKLVAQFLVMNLKLLDRIFHWLQRLFKAVESLATPDPPVQIAPELNLTDTAGTVFAAQMARIRRERLADPDISIAAVFTGTPPILHLCSSGEDQLIPIMLKFRHNVLGRMDLDTDDLPDIDLTPHNAAEKGVSRKHAAIVLKNDQLPNLIDLGSANGTYLNGRRLVPDNPRILRDGDYVRLGHLLVLFLMPSELRSSRPPPSFFRLYSESRHDRSWWAYHRETVVSGKDALAFANALENALPEFAEGMHSPRFAAANVASNHWGVGEQEARDLITFCRLGAFRIGQGMPKY